MNGSFQADLKRFKNRYFLYPVFPPGLASLGGVVRPDLDVDLDTVMVVNSQLIWFQLGAMCAPISSRKGSER